MCSSDLTSVSLLDTSLGVAASHARLPSPHLRLSQRRFPLRLASHPSARHPSESRRPSRHRGQRWTGRRAARLGAPSPSVTRKRRANHAVAQLQSLYLGPRSSSLRAASPPPSGRSSPTHERTDSALSDSWKPSIVADWPKSFSFTSTQRFPAVKKLGSKQRKRILVTGGAGFVGSHLVDRLMCSGHEVVVLDSFFSGSKSAIAHWMYVLLRRRRPGAAR